MDLRNFKHSKDDIDADTWDEWLADQGKPKAKPAVSPTPRAQRGSVVAGDFLADRGGRASRHRATSQTKPSKKAHTGKSASPPSVSIQIQVPSVHLPKFRVPWRAIRPWAVAIGVIVLVVFGGKALIDHMPKREKKQPAIPVTAQASADLGYKPLVPAPRLEGEPSPTKPAYNSQKKLYTFNDQYKGAKLTIDQQAVPDRLKGNEKEIQKIADSIGADQSFTTTVGKVYIYAGEKGGSQRLLLANDKMLMFIQSTQQVDNASWANYIQDLQ